MTQKQKNLQKRKKELLANKVENDLYDEELSDLERDEKLFSSENEALEKEETQMMLAVHRVVKNDLDEINRTGNVIIMMDEENNIIHNRI